MSTHKQPTRCDGQDVERVALHVPIDPEAEQDFVGLIEGLTNYIRNERVRAYNEGVDATLANHRGDGESAHWREKYVELRERVKGLAYQWEGLAMHYRSYDNNGEPWWEELRALLSEQEEEGR